MPNHTYKSAAVPFVNQKGERSMKRVKVERYVAGKKPAYAKDDEDEEYYTTDEEEEDDNNDEVSDDERAESSDEDDERERKSSLGRRLKLDKSDDIECVEGSSKGVVPARESIPEEGDDDDDEEDDDPRFRMLKKMESKASSSRMLADQINALNSRAVQIGQDKNVVMVDEDEEEDEEEVRLRHAAARARELEEPLGPQIMLDEFADKQLAAKQVEFELNRSKKEETEDILKDLKLTGIKPKSKKDDTETQEKVKEMIEQARQEATLQAQLYKKIEEDNKRELEKEALSKGDIGAHDIEAVKTDDEDEELAYEEWKLREINRVLRDKKERLLAKAK